MGYACVRLRLEEDSHGLFLAARPRKAPRPPEVRAVVEGEKEGRRWDGVPYRQTGWGFTLQTKHYRRSWPLRTCAACSTASRLVWAVFGGEER